MTHRTTELGCLLGIAVVLVLTPQISASEDIVCAFVELDSKGDVWVNGVARQVEVALLEGCPEAAILVIAPDSSAPSGAFVELLSRAQSWSRPTRLLLPSGRRELFALFGYDPLRMCQSFSRREIESLPAKESMISAESIVVLWQEETEAERRHVDSLQTQEDTRFGLVDQVADSNGAYSQQDGFQLVVSDKPSTAIRLREADFYYPPAPGIRFTEFDACPYPIDAK